MSPLSVVPEILPEAVVPDSGITETTVERSRRDRALVHGVAWAAIARVAAQVVTWAVTLIVARILTPSDYGVVSAATVYLGLVGLLTEFGLATAIISQRDLSKNAIAQLGGFSACLGVAAWIFTVVAAPLVASLVGVPEVKRVLPVLGFATAISSLNALPFALLQKQLKFKVLSSFEILKAVVSATALLTFAMSGFGFWSLVLNEVLAVVVLAIALLWKTRYKISWPHIPTIKSSLSLSGLVLTSRLAWYTYSNADITVVSRVLGKTILGDYAMACNLTNLPSQKIAATLMSVTTGVLASVQNDKEELRRYFLRIVEALALILFPATIGLALVAPELVRVLLGAKWEGAIPIMQALAFATAIRSMGPLCSQVLLARLRAQVEMKYTVMSAIVLPIGFVVGSHYGAVGVALAWTALSAPLVAFQFWLTCSEIELPISHLIGVLLRPSLAVGAMAAALVALRISLTQAHVGAGPQLIALVAGGAVVYSSIVATTMFARVRALTSLVRR